MRRHTLFLVTALALVLAGCTLAQNQAQSERPVAPPAETEFAPLTLDGLTPQSERPLFARFTVSSDRGRVLNVMLDESEGTGAGYDIAYVDLDFDNTLTPEERVDAAHAWSQDELAFVGFGPFKFEEGYLVADDGLIQELEVHIRYERMPIYDDRYEVTGSEEGMMGNLSLTVVENQKFFRYMIQAELPLATTPEDAQIVRIDGEVALTCETQAQDDGTLGVALICSIGEANLFSEGTAELRITTGTGELVAEEAGALHDFGFG